MLLCPRDGAGAARRTAASRLEEAHGLATAIDLDVVASETVPVRRVRSGSFFGRGTVERVGGLVESSGAGLVSVDAALTPVQQRTLENAWKAKVIDRTGLILEIFGARARTREGVLQVELAHLTYQRSRLVRSWTHLERQRGGFGFLGGPGETQIEADRRMISERIARLRRELDDVRRTRALHRKARHGALYGSVALVGYTNAGKSALFNRLTGSKVVARDQLFATLDPTMRAMPLPSGRSAVLSDTVGFVSDLPTTLVVAFRATLEEVVEADVIVHVRDVSNKDSEFQKRDVAEVLREMGMDVESQGNVIEVLNKMDAVDDAERERLMNLAARRERVVALSARTGENCGLLADALDGMLADRREIVHLSVDHGRGGAVSWLYRNSNVLGRCDTGDSIDLEVEISAVELARFRSRYPVKVSPGRRQGQGRAAGGVASRR